MCSCNTGGRVGRLLALQLPVNRKHAQVNQQESIQGRSKSNDAIVALAGLKQKIKVLASYAIDIRAKVNVIYIFFSFSPVTFVSFPLTIEMNNENERKKRLTNFHTFNALF